MDNAKGRYWDKPLSWVDGCTPCSPGCEHCWSMAMAKRFHKWPDKVTVREDRIHIPYHTRKPTVFAVWNDILHDDVPMGFLYAALDRVSYYPQHTFLFLTKRAHNLGMIAHYLSVHGTMDNFYLGVTVCNQEEADAKIPELLKVPGRKWLSIEPMLGPIDLSRVTVEDSIGVSTQIWPLHGVNGISAVILGGETGNGARPMHPDWVRSIRNDCEAANVPFYFKQWGEYCAGCQLSDDVNSVKDGILMDFFGDVLAEDGSSLCSPDSITRLFRVGKKRAGRLLDGRTHDELPWG